MTFPAFWLFKFLNYAGWPRTKGLLIRKKVVNCTILWGAATQLAKAGIAIGALRPKIAVSLLGDLFPNRDWSRQPATELWVQFDPSEQVANKSDEPPEEVIVEILFPSTFYNNRDISVILPWEFVLSKEFQSDYYITFAEGLIWGLSHPEEALDRHEKQRQRFLKNLSLMLQAGLKVHPLETLEKFADETEEFVNSFQNEIRPFAKVPQELLSLPVIAARLKSI